MDIRILEDAESLGREAAEAGAGKIKEALRRGGEASVILATGNSQLDMLKHLVTREGIDWSGVTCFHLDEYVGMSDRHPASFRKYLREKFVEMVPSLKAFHYVNGDAPDPREECGRLGELISQRSIDVAFIGIGENGHIAFNDPPADFETEEAFIVVKLDEACRRQQMGEGWFESIGNVPERAISMSIRQIMKSRSIICSVPDLRKAEAVRNTVEREVSNLVPATILRQHGDCVLFLDRESSSLLE